MGIIESTLNLFLVSNGVLYTGSIPERRPASCRPKSSLALASGMKVYECNLLHKTCS